MKKVAISILISIISSATILAQGINKFPLKPKRIVENSNCELKIRELTLLDQDIKSESLMIIISHIGRNEDVDFGRRRLYNAKALFTKTESKFIHPSESVVTAEGEKVEGEGYLDFYVQGELELRINFKKNRELYIRPCALNFPTEKYCSTEFEKLFYPCKSKK